MRNLGGFIVTIMIAVTVCTVSCSVTDGPSLKGFTSTDQPSTGPNDPDPTTEPTPTPTPEPTPTPTPNPTPVPCSNAPANAHYTIPGEEGPNCSWACDANHYPDGVGGCVYTAAVENLNCNAGEVAIGLYGRTGAWFDQLGVRCATFSGGTITGSPVNGPALGNPVTGGAFTYDCPAGNVLARIQGGNQATGANWCSGTSSVFHRYGCVDLSNGTLSALSTKYGESMAGTCNASLLFDHSCATGTYVYGITVGANGDSNYVGFTLGLNCR